MCTRDTLRDARALEDLETVEKVWQQATMSMRQEVIDSVRID